MTAEDLKRAKESYYSKDSIAILDVIVDERNRYIVILGDPGAGKSTLTKYIILSVLQINNDEKLSSFFNSYLPLRVELREFAGLCAEKECKTFLDYFQHLAETEGYGLTKEEVDNYLKNDGKAIIIFDGLDEIFDPKEWERINRMIVGFALDYPKVRIIVTSRIVGYKRKILDDAGFAHFTLQDFEKEQIETFLDKWYPFVVDEKEIESRKSRITKALKDSPSIRQLAGNPLLLTILAIIGKHQELPRERWKLYEHAASVLVENWEVNKHLKRSPVDMDFIGEDDKKELLMRIAFKMQSGPDGLAGNFIHRKTLQQEIAVYLQNRYQKDPSNSKVMAESIIDQLRKVNFILCLYGADFYGFVHRTFLEYFCAMDIVQKFDNHELNIETLKSDYFEKYWEDPTWHEVLSLVCGMKEKFAGDIIECLMQEYNPQWFGNRPPLNISLAIKCLSEVRNPNAIGETAKKLLERVIKLFEMVRWTQDIKEFLAEEIVPAAKMIGSNWPHRDLIVNLFHQTHIYRRESILQTPLFQSFIFQFSFSEWSIFQPSINLDLSLSNAWAEFISEVGSDSEIVYKVLIGKVRDKDSSGVLAVLALGKYTPKNKQVFSILVSLSTIDKNVYIRRSAVQELAHGWHDDPETLSIIKQFAATDKEGYVRRSAVQELARGWRDDPETLNIIKQLATTDKEGYVRSTAVQELARGWHDDPETLNIIKQLATTDKEGYVRSTAVQVLVRGWHDDPETHSTIKQFATTDKEGYVRSTAVQVLVRGWHDDPETHSTIKQFAITDKDSRVKSTAVQELARGWYNDSGTLPIIKQCAIDNDRLVRITAVQELARDWYNDSETLTIVKQRATTDDDRFVRSSSVRELAYGWHDDPETLSIIKQLATTDEEGYVRSTAVQELARGWHDDPETLSIIKQLATTDEDNDVRDTAVQELKKWWGEEVEENIEENISSEILKAEEVSGSKIVEIENVKEDFSGVVVSEGIESEDAKTVSQPAKYGDGNFEISEKVSISEDADTGRVDDIAKNGNVSKFRVNDDHINSKTRYLPLSSRVGGNTNIEPLSIHVSKREKELVRVAAVQLNFKLSDSGFPPKIIDKDGSKEKVLRALEMALNEGADIVCLPELCVCEDWIPEIKGVCQDVAVIAGSYYDAEKHNVCKPLLGSGADIPSQIKITPSPFEEAGIINKKMVPGDKLYIYDTRVGKFSVLICRDFINLRHHLRGKTDIIFVPSYNEKIERFHEDANNHITNSPGYIVISNTSLYGGTSVFGIIRKEFNSDLVDAGYKVEGDGIYKLCELKKGEEGMIIADFNLIHKSIQVPAPANPAEEIRPVSYIEKKIIKF